MPSARPSLCEALRLSVCEAPPLLDDLLLLGLRLGWGGRRLPPPLRLGFRRHPRRHRSDALRLSLTLRRLPRVLLALYSATRLRPRHGGVSGAREGVRARAEGGRA